MGKYQGVEWVDHMIDIGLTTSETSKLFSKMVLFTLPSTKYDSSTCSTPWGMLDIVSLFNFIYFMWMCSYIILWILTSFLPVDYLFYMLICHPHTIFCEDLLKYFVIFCWIIYLIVLQTFFIHSRYLFFFWYMC